MALYEYACADGHVVETIRKMSERHSPLACHCGKPSTLLVSLPHCLPDGMYSYAPNIGSEQAFETRRHALREGIKVIPKQDQPRTEY